MGAFAQGYLHEHQPSYRTGRHPLSTATSAVRLPETEILLRTPSGE